MQTRPGTNLVPMSSFLLLPGAGGSAWFWHRVVPLLVASGNEAIAVDLPASDETAGLHRYTHEAVRAASTLARHNNQLVVVGQSMGGLTAPLVAAELDATQIIMLNAMTPAPSETGAQWWSNTGQAAAADSYAQSELGLSAAPVDPLELYFHDADEELLELLSNNAAPVQSGRPFDDPWPLTSWPDIATRFLAAEQDRLFPLEFQRRIVTERLRLAVEPVPGGHLNALTRPEAVVAALLHA